MCKYQRSHVTEIANAYDDLKLTALCGEVHGCPKCDMLPLEKRPIPLLASDVLKKAKRSRLYEVLEQWDNCFERKYKPGLQKASDKEIREWIEKFPWGLSVGLNPWADRTLLHWKGGPCKLMIVGQDWYPLSQTKIFVLDSDDPDDKGTWNKFWGELLDSKGQLSDSELKKAIRKKLKNWQVYATNAMLCYRPGKQKGGTSNISWESFNNCREHLKQQIVRIVRANKEKTKKAGRTCVVVSFGQWATASVARIVEADHGSDTDNVLEQLADEKRTHRKDGPTPQIAKIMKKFYRGKANKDKSGLKVKVKVSGERLVFVPLYHPSRINNKRNNRYYPDDYRSLRNLLQP